MTTLSADTVGDDRLTYLANRRMLAVDIVNV